MAGSRRVVGRMDARNPYSFGTMREEARNLIESRADHIRLDGIDRWLGGEGQQGGLAIVARPNDCENPHPNDSSVINSSRAWLSSLGTIAAHVQDFSNARPADDAL